jgi:hypothetical protein
MTTTVIFPATKSSKGKVYRLVESRPFNDDYRTFYVQTIKSSYNGQMRGGMRTRWVWSDELDNREAAEVAFKKRVGA